MEERRSDSWASAILALPPTFLRSIYSGMIYERQCFVLYTLADSVAHYARHWWVSVFYEETMQRSAAIVGMELVKSLNKGLQILQVCAHKKFPALVWTILGGTGQFQEIVDDVRRYAQMMNRVIQRRLSSSSHRQDVAEQLRHKIEFDCRILQTSLGWAYEQDKITIIQNLKSQESPGIFPTIFRSFWRSNLVLDDDLVAALISILETGLPLDIVNSCLYPREYLGSGGFGRVSKTQWGKLPVAVKEFPSEQYFEKELKVFKKFLATGYSSHVVGIIGCSENKNIVLELMDKDLIKVIQEKSTADSSPFSLDDSVDIMLQIAKGMSYLHGMNVTYRDLKPSNILIQMKEDQSLIVKLADFGASKENFGTQNGTNTSNRGTRIYMAPEMMNEGGNYTRKVDVHSFGMLCFEILTGKQPFIEPERIKKGERPLLPKDIPISLDKLIRLCWDEETDKRPSFTEICDELWLIKEKILTKLTKEEADTSADGITELKLRMGGLSCLSIGRAESGVQSNGHEDISSPERIEIEIESDSMIAEIDATNSNTHSSPERVRGNELSAGHSKSDSRRFNSLHLLSWFHIGKPRKKQKLDDQNWKAKLKDVGIKDFEYAALKIATKGFSQVIGRGGSSCVYRGFLVNDGLEVAVKVLNSSLVHNQAGFVTELSVICKLRHNNLVGLRGFCHEKGKWILVYDYMQNGSLDRHLFSPDTLLPWSRRYKIVKGVAEGLAFLHFGLDRTIVHRDIKAANVLLDAQMEAHLGDFGLAKLLEEERSTVTTRAAGTVGFMAPESIFTGKASHKSDTFAFGILLLEVACGRRAIDPGHSAGFLLDDVWEAQQGGNLLKVADPKLQSSYKKEEMRIVLSLGLLCSFPDPELRPTTRTCSGILNGKVPLPDVPTSKPLNKFW